MLLFTLCMSNFSLSFDNIFDGSPIGINLAYAGIKCPTINPDINLIILYPDSVETISTSFQSLYLFHPIRVHPVKASVMAEEKAVSHKIHRIYIVLKYLFHITLLNIDPLKAVIGVKVDISIVKG